MNRSIDEENKETFRDKAGKQMHRFRQFCKSVPRPAWWEYIRTHRSSLFAVLFVAVLVTAGFTFQKFLGGLEKYGDDFTAPFSLLSAAEFVKNDGKDLSNTMECYFWGSLHLLFVVFLSMYWIRRMGFFFGKKKKTLQSISIAVIRTVLAVALFVLLLCYDQQKVDWAPFVWQGILNCLRPSFFVAVPLKYLSRVPWMYTRFVLAFLVPTLLLTNWHRVRLWTKKAWRIHSWFFKCCIALVVAFSGYAIVELSCESKLAVFLNLRFFAIFYWVLILLFFYILTRRIALSAYICLVLAEIIGLGNYCVMQFRGSYVMFGDLLVIGTAMEVAGNYKLVMDRYFYIPLVILAVAIVLVWLLSRPLKKGKKETSQEIKDMASLTDEKKKRRRKRIRSTLIGEGILIAFVLIGMYNGFLFNYIKGNGWNYTKEIQEHGYMPYFFSNIMATANVKLEGYDKDEADAAIEAGAAAYDAEHETKEVQNPNIIVIQNEAFADLSVIYDYELDTDCMPFVHSLSENTQKGYANASVTGGPTANTEFEFLARYSFAHLSTSAIAYAQYVKTTIPSLLTVLQNQETPYYSIGYHPYYAAGYNRESVYQTLGFDEGIFYEDTSGMKRIRGLVSDRGDYEDVISMYEENEQKRDQPLFVFNVTIQNHSPFTTLRDNTLDKVKVSSFEGTAGINNYFTLLKESDEAFQELVEYFCEVDEPTIILMYGDHQPSWDDDSKKVWDEHFLAEDSAVQDRDKYYVPYVMWANYDIEEYDGLKWKDNPGEKDVLSMNYLSSVLLEAAGVRLSDYDKYLLNLRKTIPAITCKGFWDGEGVWHQNSDAVLYKEERFSYHQVCYNILFDKKHHLWERYR